MLSNLNYSGTQIKTCSFTAEISAVKERCHIKEQHKAAAVCEALLAEAQAVFRPCLIWRCLSAEALDADSLTLGGQTFAGPLFQRQLRVGQQLYPFIASCGQAAEAWARRCRPNSVQRYVAEILTEMAAAEARQRLSASLQALWWQEPSEYSPGAIPQLPLSLQRPLFALLSEGVEKAGLTLTEDCLMLPLKSVSGIFFCGAKVFYSCLLCPRADCPQRRGAYNCDICDERGEELPKL